MLQGFSGLTGYLWLGIIALTIAAYILFSSLVTAKSKITTLEATNAAILVQLEQNKATQRAFEASHKNIVLQYQALEEQYKKDASREHVAVAKPTLVQKLANKRFKEQEKEMACLTGNDAKCSSP